MKKITVGRKSLFFPDCFLYFCRKPKKDMPEFIYQEPFPVGEDKTKYRLLTKDYVKVVECDGRKLLKIAPEGLELLSKAAYSDVSFYLRASHLQKLREILDDAETSDNVKFVAYTMLLSPPRASCRPVRTRARPSALATKARTFTPARTMPSTSPAGSTRHTRNAICAIRRSCRSQ